MASNTSSGIEAVYPLTPAQEGILFHVLYEESAPLYVQQYSVRLSGSVDVETLKRSWGMVTGRHQALRALFVWEGREQPLQVIRTDVDLEWFVEDWRGKPSEEQTALLDSFLGKDRNRGFALDQAPLMRFALFRLADEEYHFVWSHHHLILDGWSLGLVVADVMETYGSILDGTSHDPAPAVRFGDFTAWLQEQDDELSRRAYWSDYLRGFDEPNMLPHLGPGSPKRWAHGQVEYRHRFRNGLLERIKTLSKANGVTVSSIMRGAWAIALSRYSGDDDVVFGATVSGRPAQLPGSLSTVGLFINTLPIRIQTEGGLSVVDWLRKIQRDQAEMTDFEASPLAEVKKHSEVESDDQLFDSILVMENIPDPAAVEGPVRQRAARYHQQSNYPLALLVMPEPEFELICLYDDQRFDESIVSRLTGQIETVLEEMCDRPQDDVSDIRLFPREELEEVLVRWNSPRKEPSHSSILELLEPHFTSRSGHVAVSGAAGEVTYGELDLRSAALAGELKHAGGQPGDRVTIVLERSPGMLVSMLGCLRAGMAYVPIDPALPPDRIQHVLADTDASAVLCGADAPDFGIQEIRVDPLGQLDPAMRDATASLPPIDSEALAYVMYTSGSTGKPKGVEITHGNLLASTAARLDYYTTQPSSYLVPSPFTFDSSVAGIYWTLATGGKLVLPDPGMEGDVAHMSQLIERHQVTHMLTLPTIYQLLLNHTEPAKLRSLKTVIVAGEPCHPSVVEDHHRLAESELCNEYGPTEATVWATVERLERHSETAPRVSIGRPIPGTEVYVLDRRFRPVPVGATGEICIAGPGLSRGYTGEMALTESAFPHVDIPGVGTRRVYRTGDLGRWRGDGRLDLIGRIDRQVKVRGQRIELEEIEANIRSHHQVEDVAVIAHHTDTGATQLIAYIEASVEPTSLRQHLAESLPAVMIPTQILSLDPLPRLSSGKVDLKALPEPEVPTVEPAVEGSMSEVESQLAEIWADVLGRDSIGLLENFFELGGDSLLSLRIVARAHEAGLRVTPRQFFEHPTIAEMAAVAEVD